MPFLIVWTCWARTSKAHVTISSKSCLLQKRKAYACLLQKLSMSEGAFWCPSMQHLHFSRPSAKNIWWLILGGLSNINADMAAACHTSSICHLLLLLFSNKSILQWTRQLIVCWKAIQIWKWTLTALWKLWKWWKWPVITVTEWWYWYDFGHFYQEIWCWSWTPFNFSV